MTFNPTHEFRGLKLSARGAPNFEDNVWFQEGSMWFQDESGRDYLLPESVVTKIKPRPKPGEVWKYTGPDSEFRILLEFVNIHGSLVDIFGNETPYEGNEDEYIKVLNSDGTPA